MVVPASTATMCTVQKALADPRPEFGSHTVSTEREPIAEVWGQSPQPGPGAEPLAPMKLNAFLHFRNLKSWPICPKICFCKIKKKRRMFGGHRGILVPLGSASGRKCLQYTVVTEIKLYIITYSPAITSNQLNSSRQVVPVQWRGPVGKRCGLSNSVASSLYFSNPAVIRIGLSPPPPVRLGLFLGKEKRDRCSLDYV